LFSRDGRTLLQRLGEDRDCTISSAAMDQLGGSKKTMPSEREAQFLRLRDKIERLASDLFEKSPTKPVRLIRIFIT
jgi:hypothetical protein